MAYKSQRKAHEGRKDFCCHIWVPGVDKILNIRYRLQLFFEGQLFDYFSEFIKIIYLFVQVVIGF
jgi:hypothetical protein